MTTIQISQESFPSLEHAEEMIHSMMAHEGYAINRLRSKKSKLGILRKVWICCVLGRKPKENENRVRNRKSRRIQCPWAATIKNMDNKWYITIVNDTHNHEPDQELQAVPYIRRRNVNQNMQFIQDLYSRSTMREKKLIANELNAVVTKICTFINMPLIPQGQATSTNGDTTTDQVVRSIENSMESIHNSSMKKRKRCAVCHLEGHNRRSCNTLN